MKRIVSIILCTAMLFTMSVMAYAEPDMDNPPELIENYDGYPVIVIRGFNILGMYDESTDEKAFDINVGNVLRIVFNIFLDYLFKDSEKFFENITEAVDDIAGELACDKNGDSINPDVTVVQLNGPMSENPEYLDEAPYDNAEGILHTAVDKFGAENVYFFNYDYRLTPKELAAQLNELIETAKENSGKDKVKIICASMGGIVTTAYFNYYGGKNVDTAVYVSSAHNGVGVAGKALSGNIEIIPENIEDFFVTLSEHHSNDFLAELTKLAGNLGFFGFLADIGNEFIAENKDKLYDETFRDVFATSVGLWTMCPDADFEDAVASVFEDCEKEYSVLLEKLEECKDFNFSTEEILKKAEKDKVKLCFVSNYDSGLLPIYEESSSNGDRFLETTLTSGFATVADKDKTLSVEQIAKADKKYISPDNVIDASDCVYKDSTWFVKNATHICSDYGTDYSEFVFTLLMAEKQPTIDTFSQYPQFMQSNKQLTLKPLSAVN